MLGWCSVSGTVQVMQGHLLIMGRLEKGLPLKSILSIAIKDKLKLCMLGSSDWRKDIMYWESPIISPQKHACVQNLRL